MHFILGAGGGGYTLYGYIGMCDPKGYGFSIVLVLNRVSISVKVINTEVIKKVGVIAHFGHKLACRLVKNWGKGFGKRSVPLPPFWEYPPPGI